MYAPVMNNIGPALISQGFTNAANYQMQGAEAMAGGISSAGSSVGSALVKVSDDLKKKAGAEGEAAGAMSAIQEYQKAGIGDAAGYEEFAASFQKTKNPWERLGMATSYLGGLENVRKTQINNAQIAAYGQRQQAGQAHDYAQDAVNPVNIPVRAAAAPAWRTGAR